MADTRTTAYYLDLKLLTESGGATTFKLNDPRSDLTRSDVVNAYSDTLAARILTNTSGEVYAAVGSLAFVEETIIKTDLE